MSLKTVANLDHWITMRLDEDDVMMVMVDEEGGDCDTNEANDNDNADGADQRL